MNKLLTILFTFLVTCVLAQVPQGVGYQGVATDANGIELVNQSISIRASVLSGSATGTIEWEETHATSTDTFGLFTLTIGQGTNTTNGLQTSFADISWGTNTHYLKIEMDVAGGTNYSFMGTNQMMSVPYALYAENANINYDSISNILSNDSTFITTVGGGIGGGSGCDMKFPDGLDGEPVYWEGYYNDYTVPAGKTLYITVPSTTETRDLIVNGVEIITGPINQANGPSMYNPIVVASGEVVSGQADFHALLFDNSVITPISWTLNGYNGSYFGSNYIVPTGKELYILQQHGSKLSVDGVLLVQTSNSGNSPKHSLGLPIKVSSGITVSASSWNSSFNGYLVDENYFANCGGGGSSSTTTINYDSLATLISMDSTFLANVGGGGSGCDIQYPDGLDGEPITYNLSSSYTVPVGKNLYITNLYSQSGFFTIDGVNVHMGYSNYNNGTKTTMPFIAKQGQVLLHSTGAGSFNGFLVDALVEPITYNLSSIYTVPAGKNLYITNLYSQSGFFTIDGVNVHMGYSNYNNGTKTTMPFIAKQGQVLLHSTGAGSFNGYLADENYFAGCGGGGSSNSGTGNMIVSTFGDTLTMNGQSIIVPGISFLNVIPSFGSVTDTSGNTYQTLQIGSQEWMAENLITEHFANGDPIPMMTSGYSNNNAYVSWTWPENSYANEAVYGKMYNGNAVYDSRNVCPSGWHIPSISEWVQLLNLFGNTSPANNYTGGNALKAVNISSGNPWSGIGTGTNESYMSLVPAGVNWGGINSGAYYDFHNKGCYWTSQQYSGGGRSLRFEENVNTVDEGSETNYYFLSVRCVKD